MSRCRLITADVLDGLAQLESGSVHTCVTSPPYYALRDYGVDGQLGLEKTPEEYVERMVEVFREVRRVLRDDGTLWLNIGDSYAGSWGNYGGQNRGNGTQRSRDRGSLASNPGAHDPLIGKVPGTANVHGCKPKDLIGIPWMLAFALRADGWYLRCDCIWSKPNPMPESVTDRPTKAHEYVFLLSKSERYFYDAAAIRDVAVETNIGDAFTSGTQWKQEAMGRQVGTLGTNYGNGTRNKRSVWTIATEAYPEAHFATYPTALVKPCILAGSPEGGTVLDPFTGSGTTGVVALQYGRNFVGVELNPEYVRLAEKRLAPYIAQELLPL